MTVTRRGFTGLMGAGAMMPGALWAQDVSVLAAIRTTLFGATTEFESAMKTLRTRGQPDVAAALITALRFGGRRQDAIARTLISVTGEDFGTDWFAWMLWQERNAQIIPHPSLIPFKREILLGVDDNFDLFLRKKYLERDKMRIRFEEITWGGVVKDGIPSLDNPDMVSVADATYMRNDDLVFGIEINGDVRAYPLRIMGWHEMFNAVIGGVPVALAYCTLCGSGILFETQAPGRAKPLIFGSSGFLYRSNKLMFDRETHSLWNQFTGKPVVGPLVERGIELRQRPVVITPWGDWKKAHPSTKVLSVRTGHKRDYGSGVVYQDYFASRQLMFPALVDQSKHKQKDYVFAIRQFGAARAWPLKAFKNRRVINDAIDQTALVLIGDADGRTVRAYERGTATFKPKDGGLVDANGGQWRVTEGDLIGPDGARLPRVAGHVAYWFAWDNYLGDAASVFEG